jgi:phosphoribosylanthranilate isomerase
MKVKICGITGYEDARLALELGADLIGFVLASSPRRVDPREVGEIVGKLRAEGLLKGRGAVGVFVNESPAAMALAMSEGGLDAAQVHGDESPEDCAALPFPWYRALRIGSASDATAKIGAGWACGRILADALSSSGYGGTGSSIAEGAAWAARDAARDLGKEFFLAGGIGPHNAARIAAAVEPDGIDVCSGVEERAGKKSREKLELLFSELGRAAKEGGRAEE